MWCVLIAVLEKVSETNCNNKSQNQYWILPTWISVWGHFFFQALVKSILIGFSIIFKKRDSVTIDWGRVLIWRVIKIGANKVST